MRCRRCCPPYHPHRRWIIVLIHINPDLTWSGCFGGRATFVGTGGWIGSASHVKDLNMSWSGSSDGGSGRRGYHHGNLREALIEAALELIGAKGPAGFTIAEAARLAGVSPAAPYRHFRDAESLLAEVATRGFDAFRDRLAAALDRHPTDPARAAEAVGRAYLGFAKDEPAFYAAIFETGIDRAPYPELQAAGDRAFA